MPTWVPIALTLVGILATWTVSIAWLVWWLGEQFQRSRHVMYGALAAAKVEMVQAIEGDIRDVHTLIRELNIKFDSHEKLNAEQFKQMELAIMKIELREQTKNWSTSAPP